MTETLAIDKPAIKTTTTENGVWRTAEFENGAKYREFTSHRTMFDRPLISYVSGIDPETLKRPTARGIIAVGPKAIGTIAIGQFAAGSITIGQFCAARFLAVGQFCVAPLSVGQFAIGGAIVAQMGVAVYGIVQSGIVTHNGIGQNLVKLAQLFG
jgi:hypothetical protein